MEKIQFKDLEEGMEILVLGGIYGEALYEVFDTAEGFCIITNGDDLLALPEIDVDKGEVKIYYFSRIMDAHKTKEDYKLWWELEQEEKSTTEKVEVEVCVKNPEDFESAIEIPTIREALQSIQERGNNLALGGGMFIDLQAMVEKEFQLSLTQDEVNTLQSILGFFLPKSGDTIYNIQKKLSPYEQEEVVEEGFDRLELVKEDGERLAQPLFGVDGYFLNKECMCLKFN